jgi:hypothetical protein
MMGGGGIIFAVHCVAIKMNIVWLSTANANET